ncbi:hypothetical protein K438DRAFT_1983808 [Mycena galopus ATCC 62051]|nr:hypothetical protein K438DRAFT_1983808 [Mycena galopus ATCC 62051]
MRCVRTLHLHKTVPAEMFDFLLTDAMFVLGITHWNYDTYGLMHRDEEGRVVHAWAGLQSLGLHELDLGEVPPRKSLEPMAVTRSDMLRALLWARREGGARIWQLEIEGCRNVLSEDMRYFNLYADVVYDVKGFKRVERNAGDISLRADAVDVLARMQADMESFKALFTGYKGRGFAATAASMRGHANKSKLIHPADAPKIERLMESIQTYGVQMSQQKTKVKRKKIRANEQEARAKQLKTSRTVLSFPGTIEDKKAAHREMQNAGANLVTSMMEHHLSKPEPVAATPSTQFASPSTASTSTAPSASASMPSASTAPPASQSASTAPSASTSTPPSAGASASIVTSASASTSSAPSAGASASTPPSASTLNAVSASVSTSSAARAHDLEDEALLAVIRRENTIVNHNGQAPVRPEPPASTADKEDGVEFSADPAHLHAHRGPDGLHVEVAPPDALSRSDLRPEDNAVNIIAARIAFLRFLLSPLEMERALKACAKDGGFQCPKCQLYLHDAERLTKIFKSVPICQDICMLPNTNPIAHLAHTLCRKFMHTEWADLEIEAARVEEDGVRFACIRCLTVCGTMSALQKHYLNSCKDKAYFAALHLDDAAIQREREPVKPVASASSSAIVGEMNTVLGWEKDLITACEGDEDEEAMVRRFMENLKLAKWRPPTEKQIEHILQDTSEWRM